MFESRENTPAIAAILSPAACVSDVMNKAGVCGKSIHFKPLKSRRPFLHFTGLKKKNANQQIAR